MLEPNARRFLPQVQLPPARRNRLLLVVAILAIVLGLLWAARGALFPYIIGLVIAYLVLPLVNGLDRLLRLALRGWRGSRILAIVVTYLILLVVVGLFFMIVVPVIAQQFRVLWDSRDELTAQGEKLTGQFLGWYDETMPPELKVQIETNLRETGGSIVGGIQSGFFRTLGVVGNTVSTIIGLIVIPFWLFYILNDEATVMRRVLAMIPTSMRGDVINIGRIADGILGKYLRGQLILCVIVGVMATVGLSLLGVPFPAVLGLIAGVFEILPFVGPIIGLVPAVIVATIQQPILGLWTFVLFMGIQQLENLVLVPRISGKAVEVHAALIMVVLVIGNQVAGLGGMILAVPVTAIIRDVFKYLHLRFQDVPVEPREAMARIGRTPLHLEV